MDGKSLDALERLGRLRDAGALSEEEFQAEKQAIMNGPGDGSSAASSAARTSDQETPVPQDLLGPLSEPHAARSDEGSRVPVWARKKRGLSPLGIAGILALIFLTALGSAMWFLNRAENETYSFMATGSANVRDAPTATEGKVVAQLAEGDFITGRVQGTGEKQWVEITDGPLRGRFVWGGNLASEGPDDMLGGSGDGLAQGSGGGANTQNDPTLAGLMSRHQVGGGRWSAVSSIAPEHEGKYSLLCDAGAAEFRGRRLNSWWGGRIDQTDTYERIYRSGSRYIQIIGQTYFVRDFAGGNMRVLETIVSGRNVPVDLTIRVPRCSEGSRNTVSRAQLFTPSGLSDATNISRANCDDVVVARYVLTCSATILNNMPNASSASSIRRSLAVSQQESAGRCAAQAQRVGSVGDIIVQQSLGDVYQRVAEQAVYGGDVSDLAISLCFRSVGGSMAGAGFLPSGRRQAGVAEHRPIASRASSGQAVRDAEAAVRYAREDAEEAARDAQAAALAAENQARRNGG